MRRTRCFGREKDLQKTSCFRKIRYLIKIGIICGLLYWVSIMVLEEDHVSALGYLESSKFGATIQVQDNMGRSVPGAAFRLYESEHSMIPLHYIKITKWREEDTLVTYSKTITGYNGVLHFYGLEEGIYYLEEITVPYGYQKVNKRMQIRVDATTSEAGIDYYIVLKKRK